jgi:hypothetical protein
MLRKLSASLISSFSSEEQSSYALNSSSSAFASFRSAVSKLSVRRRCCSAESGNGGYFVGIGKFKSGAISGRASAELWVHGVLVELRYGIEHRQARARGTFTVVVVGLGIAEECHHAIPKVLGDMPAEALDYLRRRMMVPGDHLPPLFRIKLRCDAGRVHQIAKQHCQMPPLTR